MRLFVSLLASLSVLLLLVSAPGCAPAPSRDPFAYAADPISVTLEGTYLSAADPEGAPRPFAARVGIGAPREDAPACRDLTVTFTAPAALAGVTVTAALSPASSGTVTRTVTLAYPSDYGEILITAKGQEFDGLLRPAEALLPSGYVVEVSPRGEDGSFTVTRRSGDGTREAQFTFTAGQPLPSRVILTEPSGRMEVRVICGLPG